MKLRRRASEDQALSRHHTGVVTLIPEDGDVDELVAAVAEHRGRPLTILPMDTPPTAPSGAWITSDLGDLIVVDSTASVTRRSTIICHELAHMLLGHKGPALNDSALLARPSLLRPDVAARFLTRTGYDDASERDAELLGTLLAAECTRRAGRAAHRQGRVASRLQ